MSDANKPTVFGLDIEQLLPNTTPLEALVILKTLNAEGVVQLTVRYTPGLTTWDMAGLLAAARVLNDEAMARSSFATGGDDDAA